MTPSTGLAALRRELALELARFLPPEEAQAESWLWFQEGLGLGRASLLLRGDEPAPPELAAKLEAWLERRRQGLPWAYLHGSCLFRGRRFRVDPSVLIPRPETELLLEAALALGDELGVDRACDIGTGSGILGICLALERPWAIRATDLSPAALETARGNAWDLGARVDFFQGDLLAPLEGPLGLVVSNPPYVDPADAPGLQPELAFEPAMALFAPEAGLALSTELLRQARERGAQAVLLEIGAGQGAVLAERARQLGWERVRVMPDFAGHDRVLEAR